MRKYNASGTLINGTFASGLSNPFGITFDSSDNLYIAKVSTTGTFANSVVQVTPAGVASTFASGFNQPAGVVVRGANLYVSNAGGSTVSKVSQKIPATTQVNILSSIPSRPMQIGGSNNSAVSGINLASSELAKIFTSAGGTVTIGAVTTGNITFDQATPVSTAGTSLVVLQSSAGEGQIILDDDAGGGIALDGNAGSVTITAGTGGIVAAASNVAGTSDISAPNTERQRYVYAFGQQYLIVERQRYPRACWLSMV